ncbi:hypothetical protein J2Z31_001727 [Sinorhizobium kostiense]|uniref:Initiator Rep protein domain-containing protein n=1 Tax=Sinorhizobium kostiense TaxID=76747 RepID=A0ABS4QX59_9HYPH|nr:hypothetical protein [Sinorhizobium kostiense]MBP2235235.1 hypothetical protein [Sinorhizobium kostiense]
MAVIAPQSPRPAEMLAGVVIDNGAVDLTGFDLALHELLISRAYENDRSMTATSYEIPLVECLRFLGSDARRDAVERSLGKMEQIKLSFAGEDGRSFRGVKMLTFWEATKGTETSLGYQFPDPIRWLMRSMPAYGYIELNALGRGSMRSKYSHMLYKRIALDVAKHPWRAGEDNRFELTFTPEQLAEVVGFPPVKGVIPFGKLQERVISKVIDDFAGVRKFDVRISYDGMPAPKKGTSVGKIELHVRVNPDSHHTVFANTAPFEKAGYRIGAPDEPRYRINSVFWLRVPRTFKTLGIDQSLAKDTWLVALKEALDNDPLTPAYATRRYRGANLLSAIDADGVEAAAWNFFAEETELGRDLVGFQHVIKNRVPADTARKERVERVKKPKASAPSPAPVAQEELYPTFENCTHIDLEIDTAASKTDLDDIIYEHINSIVWNGTRRIVLRAFYEVPGQRDVRQHFRFIISPEDENELLSELRRIGTWIDTPTFRITEDKAA